MDYLTTLGNLLKQKTERISKLTAENKQLRELSEVMLKCIAAGRNRDCWSCPAHKQFDELRWYCYIKDDAAKLGIEVK